MTKRAYAIIVAGFLTVSITYAIRYAYGLLLPEMVPAWGVSMTEAGIIYAVYLMAYMVGTPFMGALGDRFNNRIILLFFTALLAIGALLMAQAKSVVSASFYFMLAGLGNAACWVPVIALVQRWVPEKRKGLALSIVTMGVGVGVPIWSFLLPVIVGRFDWAAGWISLGVVGLAVAGLNWILVRNPPLVHDENRREPSRIGSVSETYSRLLKDRTFWFIGAAYLFVGANEMIPFTFIGLYTRDVLDFSYAISTRFVAIITFVGLASQLLLGSLSDKLGRIRIMIICTIFMGTGCLGMAYFKSQWSLYGTAACYGMGFGAIWPMFGAVGSDFFPKNMAGSVVGLWTIFFGVGSVSAPIVGGWMIDTTGDYPSVFILGGVCGLLSAISLIPLLKKPTLAQTPLIS